MGNVIVPNITRTPVENGSNWGSVAGTVEPPLAAARIFADNTLGSDITDGTYSISGRDSSGSDGNAYTTVTAAVTAMTAGETLYLREGPTSFSDIGINLSSKPVGSALSWYTVKSYPNEWAVIDGAHAQATAIFTVSNRTPNAWGYWKFENFEVTGGGQAGLGTGDGAFYFDSCSYVEWRYMYIHRNYGRYNNNSAGINLHNDSGAPNHIVIEFNHLFENGDPTTSTNDNSAQIIIMSDYKENPSLVDPDAARRSNRIRYNLLDNNGTIVAGIKDKNEQALADHTGAPLTGVVPEDVATHIHHNIVLSPTTYGMKLVTDYTNAYNNIIDFGTGTSLTRIGIANTAPADSNREMFHNVFYNNLTLNTKMQGIGWNHGTGSVDSYPGLDRHPYFYAYNNIIDNHEIKETNAAITNDGSYPGNIVIDYATLDIDHNYIYRVPDTEYVVSESAGGSIRTFTAPEYISAGHATAMWQQDYDAGNLLYSGLSGASKYITNGTHSLGSNPAHTVAGSGKGGAHPYLAGVTIPSYIGAVDPSDNAWVGGVMGLTDINNLKSGAGDPNWTEG